MKKYIIGFILVILVLSVVKYTHHQAKITSNVITVTKKTLHSDLYYSGIIQPLKSAVITSPVEGVINDVRFHFGDTVQKGQILLTITSEKFKTDYKTALMQYVKTKNELNTAKDQLLQSQFLYKNELIAADDLKLKKSAFYTAELAYMQAQDVLAAMLKQLNGKDIDFVKLSIEEVDKINQAFHMQDNSQQLIITAPANGIVLLPIKNDNSDKKLEKGDSIKQGDVLGLIGDTQSLVIRVNVSEFDINQIQLGQAVKVTGAAFPDYELQGSITGIEHQAHAGQSGLPIFTIEIVVPHISAQEQAIIHVGMSAKVEIKTGMADAIVLPLAAVQFKNNNPIVNVQDPQTGKVHEVMVKTGQTTPDSVMILSSLHSGDKVVIPH